MRRYILVVLLVVICVVGCKDVGASETHYITEVHDNTEEFTEPLCGIVGLDSLRDNLIQMKKERIEELGVSVENIVADVPGLIQSDFFVDTYDELNYRNADGPAQSLLSGGKGVTIVKYYQLKDEVSGNILPLSYYITDGVSKNINIEDEQLGNGYKLMDWFTSIDSWVPSGGLASYSDAKAEHFNGGHTGTTVERLRLLDEEEDKVLHLLYELHPMEKHVGVVKVYISGGDSEEADINWSVDSSSITGNFLSDYNASIPGYSLVDVKCGTDGIRETESWDSLSDIESVAVPGDNRVKLKADTTAVYLLYEKDEKSGVVLFANELSYRYSLKDLTNGTLFKVLNSVPSAIEGRAYAPDCKGHICTDSNCEVVHMCTNEKKYLAPGGNYFYEHVRDEFNYNDGTNFVRDYIETGKLSLKQFATWKGRNVLNTCVEPNAEFTIYRDRVRDKVTLYPGLNDSLGEELKNIGIDITIDSGYVPNGTRIASNTFTEEEFPNTLSTHWKSANDRHTTLRWVWQRVGKYGSEQVTDTYEIGYEDGYSPDDANVYYSTEGNIITKYYLGIEASGLEGVEDIDSRIAQKNKDLRFYPYFKMVYMAKDRTLSDVYVLSENQSTVVTYNSVGRKEIPRNKELFTYTGGFLGDKLVKEVDSSEEVQIIEPDNELVETKASEVGFKSAAKVTERSDIHKLKEILSPAIAYKIKDYDSSVYETNYKVCISDDMIDSVDEKGFIDTQSQVIDSLKEQYKQSDEDSRVMKQSNISVYTINTDTNGFIWVTKDGRQIGVKTDELTELLQNDELLELDNNTKVLTNLYISLDRSDVSLDREGNSWYYEAFNGLKVAVATTIYID